VRRQPGRGSKAALATGLAALTSDPEGSGPPGVGPLGAVVDCVVAARRLAGWSLWVELAGLAQLVSFWESKPPLADPDIGKYLAPEPCSDADPDLTDRLSSLVVGLQLPAGVHLGDLAELFVTSEISAATGSSRTATGIRVDAARALFLDDRLPRTRQLLRAGLLDWTKLRTLLVGTADLHPEVAREVEARLIPDGDLAAAEVDPLDVRSDPAHPGAPLPRVTRMTNPAVERALRAAVAVVDADALAARATRARSRRHVRGYPIEDSMARLEIEAAQEAVAAALNDLDDAVAAAKAAGDPRTADQIRTDAAIHRLTRGSHGTEGTATYADDADDLEHADGRAADGTGSPVSAGDVMGADENRECSDINDDTGDRAADPVDVPVPGGSDPFAAPGCSCGRSSLSRRPSSGPHQRPGPGTAVTLTMTLSTWLGLAEDPAVLDRFGAIPAALARQIAREAARDHPTTTTWRCVITSDDHRSVLAAADPLHTPHHDPPLRLARLVDTVHPRCVFPGCPAQARRCDRDHRAPYEDGGSTCSCNLQPLCRGHHRLKGVGLITASPSRSEDDLRPATDGLTWRTVSNRSYHYEAPAPVPEVADPDDLAKPAARRSGLSSCDEPPF
jgi:hypothetical protein